MINLEDRFSCFLCIEIMEDAVEFLCCFNCSCEKCAQQLQLCSFCAKPFQYRPSIQIRRIIGDLQVKCDFCSYETTRSNLKSHLKNCQQKPELCNLCLQQVPRSELIPHAISFHSAEVLSIFQGEYDKESKEERKIKDRDCINLSKKSRIGKTGKYYCGKALETNCSCCNGLCGRNNGCNCVECMRLDIEARALPKGYLVNQIGNICRKDKLGKVYCMCFFENNRKCGEGFQCSGCQQMQDVWKRYDCLVI